MSVQLGVHIGQQNLPFERLRALWRALDERVDWISVWDHFYEAPPQGGTLPHYEALATLGALAADTRRARLGCLVFCVGYRNPAVLAKAATTLDHLSGGRFELGLGAGWHEWEAKAYGIDFPPLGTRLDQLEEGVQLIRSLLSESRTTFSGRHFKTENASCLPPPLQARLPIWIGGIGEKRTLKAAARFADGWNAAYVSAEEFGRLNRVLDGWCREIGRDPASVRRSVNLSFHATARAGDRARAENEFAAQWGPAAARVRGGALFGTPDEAAAVVRQYAAQGAEMVNVALRAPFDEDALDQYTARVIPALRAG